MPVRVGQYVRGRVAASRGGSVRAQWTVAGVIVQLMQLCLALVYQTWLEQSTVLAALSANSASDASPGTAIAVLILVLGGAYIAALAAAILIDAAGGLSRCAAMLCACGGARQLLRREGRALDVLRQREADILLRVCALEATLDLQRRGGRGHAGDLAAWQ